MATRYLIESLVKMPKEKIMALPMGIYEVVFPSGVVLPMLSREIMENWYHWQLYPRFQSTALPEASSVWVYERYFQETGTVKKYPFTAKVHLELGEYTINNVFSGVADKTREMFFSLAEAYYNVVNEIYNDTDINLSEYYATGDLMDYVQFAGHPEIRKALEEYDNDPDLDERVVYKKIGALVSRDDLPELFNNEIRAGVAAGVLNSRSTEQSFGPRGKVKDIDGGTFIFPITRGYLHGLNSLADAMMESCSGKKALYSQGGPLERSEYFNRRVRLAVSSITGVVGRDCGSKVYIPWVVKEHHLDILDGNNYMTETGLRMVTRKDTHLVGETIMLRNVTTCMNHDTQTVCETCLGKNAWTIPPGEVLGIAMVVQPNAKTSQKILSVKHLDQSIEPLIVQIPDENKRVLTLGSKNKWNMFMKSPPSGHSFKLRIGTTEHHWLTNVKEVNSVNDLNPSRLSNITEIEIIHTTSTGKIVGRYVQDVRTIKTLRKGSHFSLEFLRFIKKKGWENIDDQVIEFDMEGWNKDHVLLHNPRINADVQQYLANLETFLFGSGKLMTDDSVEDLEEQAAVDRDNQVMSIGTCATRLEALQQLTDLFTPPPDSVVNKDASIAINLAEVSIYVKAAMCRDPLNLDFTFPRGDEPTSFVNLRLVTKSRSLGAAMALEGHANIIKSPATYVNKNRPSTPQDYLLIGD